MFRLAHDLDAGDDGRLPRLRRARAFVEKAVDTVAKPDHLFHGLDVNIARLLADGFDHDGVDDSDDGRVARAFQHLLKACIILLLQTHFHLAFGSIADDVFQALARVL